MKKKSGFTIIELLIVVIIIGVLATLAIPQFAKATEKAKMGKAMNMLALYNKAQALVYADTSSYAANLVAAQAEVQAVVAQDSDWTYAMTNPGGVNVGFQVVATRRAGGWTGCTITMAGSAANPTTYTAAVGAAGSAAVTDCAKAVAQ